MPTISNASFQKFTVSVNPRLNSNQRQTLAAIIIREMRLRARQGKGVPGRLRKYSTSYREVRRRRGLQLAPPNLTSSGQMLQSVRLLAHEEGSLTIGISGMDRAAFAKARWTQTDSTGKQGGPARLWLGISTAFVRRQQGLLMATRDQPIEDMPVDEVTRDDLDENNEVPFDIDDPEVDAVTRTRPSLGDPDRAGETVADRILRVEGEFLVEGLNRRTTRAQERLRRLQNRRFNEAEAVALQFVRENRFLRSQRPVFQENFGDEIRTVTNTGPRIAPIVPEVIIPRTTVREILAENRELDRLIEERERQSLLDALNASGRIEGPTLPPGDFQREYRRAQEASRLANINLQRAVDGLPPLRPRTRVARPVTLDPQRDAFGPSEPTTSIQETIIQGRLDQQLGVTRADEFSINSLSLSEQRRAEIQNDNAIDRVIREKTDMLNRLQADSIRNDLRQSAPYGGESRTGNSDLGRLRAINAIGVREGNRIPTGRGRDGNVDTSSRRVRDTFREQEQLAILNEISRRRVELGGVRSRIVQGERGRLSRAYTQRLADDSAIFENDDYLRRLRNRLDRLQNGEGDADGNR